MRGGLVNEDLLCSHGVIDRYVAFFFPGRMVCRIILQLIEHTRATGVTVCHFIFYRSSACPLPVPDFLVYRKHDRFIWFFVFRGGSLYNGVVKCFFVLAWFLGPWVDGAARGRTLLFPLFYRMGFLCLFGIVGIFLNGTLPSNVIYAPSSRYYLVTLFGPFVRHYFVLH